MCGVVMNHVFNYGLHIYDDFCVDTSTKLGFMCWSILELMKLFSLPSVNCYVLITGYFLIGNRHLRLKGIWKVWSITWLYGVGIYLIAVIIGITPFEINQLCRHATPLLSKTYWFVTSYIILLLLSPFLARVLQCLSKRQYQIALVVGGVVCFQFLLGQIVMDEQQILLFVYLFMIGGYIRQYADKPSRNINVLLCYVGILLVMYACTLYKNKPLSNSCFTIFAMAYHGLVLPLSVAFFIYVKNWKIDHQRLRKCILSIAPLSFAVYIIHTHPIVDKWLWASVSAWVERCQFYFLPFVCIIITLSVFVVGIIIEYLRVAMTKRLNSVWRNTTKDV